MRRATQTARALLGAGAVPSPRWDLMCGMECRRSAYQSEEASNADGAGFPWSGGRAVSKVGCDVWHGTPKILKPERGRFLRELGHTTCSHAGPRREAETERKFCVKLICPAELRLMALWMVVRPKTRKTSRRQCAVLMAFPSLLECPASSTCRSFRDQSMLGGLRKGSG